MSANRKAVKRHRPAQTRHERPVRKAPGASPRLLASQLYELHIAVNRGEEYISEWPGDDEISSVLVWADQNARRLPENKDRRIAVLLRIQLAERMREQADPIQLKAIQDAREAGADLAEISAVLGFAQESGAWKYEARLKVKVHGRPEDRRQPEVAHVIAERAAREERERKERERTGEQQYPAVDAAARALLDHYRAGDLAARPEDDDFWWGELERSIDDRRTASERTRLALFVRWAVHETHEAAERRGQEPTTTPEAATALERAVELVGDVGLHHLSTADPPGGGH